MNFNSEKQKAFEKELSKKSHENFLKSLYVGAVLVHSWGWDEITVEWYQITKIKGKTITIQRIGSNLRSVNGIDCYSTPKINDFCGEPITSRVTKSFVTVKDGVFAIMADYETLEDGTKKYNELLSRKHS